MAGERDGIRAPLRTPQRRLLAARGDFKIGWPPERLPAGLSIRDKVFNLADKAKKLGILVWRFAAEGAAA